MLTLKQKKCFDKTGARRPAKWEKAISAERVTKKQSNNR